GTHPPPHRSSGRQVSEDVLVDPSLVRALVTAPRTAVRVERPALVHVRGPVVLVLGDLSRVLTLHRAPPVRPDRERDPTHGRHPEVVAGEWDGSVRELLEVGIARLVADPRQASPRLAEVRRVG